MNRNGSSRILILEDTSADAELAQREIRKSLGECEFQVVHTRENFLRALQAFQPDVILSDYILPQFDGLTAVKLALQYAPLTPIIIWTSSVSEDIVVECIKAGASNYVLKENIKRLGPAIFRGLKENQSLVEKDVAHEMLRLNEKRFHALVAHNTDLLVVIGSDGRFLFVSESIFKIMGYAPAEVLGRNIFQYIHPSDAPLIGQFFKAAENVPETGAEVFTVRYLSKNNSWQYMEVACTNLLNNHSVKGIVLNMRDVTERVQIENRLRESEERFRQLADNIEEAFWIYDLHEKRYNYISPAFEKIWMVPAKEFFNDPDRFIHSIVPEDRPQIQDVIKRQLHGEKTELEYRISCPDGLIRWIWDRAFPVYDENEKLIRVAGIVADISESKKAEMELLELNQSLEQRIKDRTAEIQDLYENAPAGYHSLDENGIFVRINQTELNWLGYSREEIVGVKSFAELITAECQHVFDENFPLFKERGWIKDLEFDMLCRDGRVLPVLLNSAAIYNENNQYVMSRSTLVDITERKQVEEKLRNANSTLAKAARLKDEFLANMSHELRTPLNAVLSLTESLEVGVYGDLDLRQREILHVIHDSGRHLLELINDILDLSKIGAGKLELQIDPVEVNTLCENTLRMFHQLMEKKDLKVFKFISPDIRMIWADERRLKQMLMNLLSNAIKFTPEGGHIGLDVLKEGVDAVRFSVSDTGIGIPQEKTDELFKPFVQLDSSLSRQYPGTGLGLALVRQLAELHGGSVGFESAAEGGSRFFFIIPIKSIDAQVRNLKKTIIGSPVRTALPHFLAKILLVEDNEMNMMVTSDYLTDKGYTVIKAYNGNDAIKYAYESKPDLILTDIQMPDMNGFEVIRRLRSAPEFASVPIVALTALAMPGDREKCLQAGANEYLTKPVSLKQLAEIISFLLDENTHHS